MTCTPSSWARTLRASPRIDGGGSRGNAEGADELSSAPSAFPLESEPPDSAGHVPNQVHAVWR